MIAPTVGLYVILATSLGAVSTAAPPVWDDCAPCDVESAKVQEHIINLQSRKSLIARRMAARALGYYDWRLYPEAAEALAGALLHDPRPLARQQAASSLARMRPCLPTVHSAVAMAAADDSCLISRHAAKRALKAIDAALERDEPIMIVEEREILLPTEFESTIIRSTPLPSTTGSPFAPGAEYEVPDPSPVPPPTIRSEDSIPLTPPEPGLDLYGPEGSSFDAEIHPSAYFEMPTDSPPNVAWPSNVESGPVLTFPRPNYASSLLGIQP